MYFSIKNIVSYVLLIASLTSPLIANAAAGDDKIQDNIYKLNKDILSIIGSAVKIDVDAKNKLYALVEQSPLFDWDAMTCHVISERYFKLASYEQKKLLTENFKKLFISTYSSSFIGKLGKAPTFSTFASNGIGGDPTKYECDYAISAILQADFEKGSDETKAKKIDYFLSKSKKQEFWRLVNVNLMDVDLLAIYTSQFKDEIRNNGLNSLIEKLQVKNSR